MSSNLIYFHCTLNRELIWKDMDLKVCEKLLKGLSISYDKYVEAAHRCFTAVLKRKRFEKAYFKRIKKCDGVLLTVMRVAAILQILNV